MLIAVGTLAQMVAGALIELATTESWHLMRKKVREIFGGRKAGHEIIKAVESSTPPVDVATLIRDELARNNALVANALAVLRELALPSSGISQQASADRRGVVIQAGRDVRQG